MIAAAKIAGPHIDWAGLSPLIAVFAGALVVLMLGLARSRALRETVVPTLSVVTLLVAGALAVGQWGERTDLLAGALRLDELTLILTILFCVAGVATILLSWRHVAPREAAHGEYHALLLTSIAGMIVLVAAQNLVTVFLGLELLSIPLYVLCATEMRRASSLESGLKYLVVGSLGSATFLYGLAFLYGATGATDFGAIANVLATGGDLVTDPLLLTGIGLTIVGLAFKASVAPFHQWTPDVYEGAPTPITAFMAVATKAAAFGVMLRLFDVALIGASVDWAPALATLAAVTIIVGNVGALGQSSLKRMLAYSSVAQAGYMLAGVVVASRLGLQATVFYLCVYLVMNLAAFAVIVARERETPLGDDIASLNGLGDVAAVARLAHDDRDARARRLPGHRGLHRKVLSHRCRRGRGLHVARGLHRRRLDDLARVLPAGHRGDLDDPRRAARRRADRRRRRAPARRRLGGGDEPAGAGRGRRGRGRLRRADGRPGHRPVAALQRRARRRRGPRPALTGAAARPVVSSRAAP